MAPPLGTLGRYHLLRELGRGGMGIVYEGRDPAMPDKPLALKLILAHGAGPEELARFQREAEALAQFQHPHVVPVHELLVTPRGPCLVTDLIPGQELALVRKRQPLDPRECARLVRDLADAVQSLHAKGILHRDLKPQNVILTPDGRPILLDFGLVRVGGAQALTQTGALLGTPAYMSPEQAGGEKRVDERSDVYALGAVLYFLLTGATPFTGTTIQILHQVLRGAPPPAPSSRTAEVEVDRELDAICLRALAGKPEDRYPSAADLRDALDAYLQPAAATRALSWGVLAAGVALLLIAIGAFSLRGPRSNLPSNTRDFAETLSATESWDRAERALQEWLTVYAGHPEAARVEGWRVGYTELRARAGHSSPRARLPGESLERWLAEFPEHPAQADAEHLLAGCQALDTVVAGLGECTPQEGHERLAAWRDAHPQHPDATPQGDAPAWLSTQLEACDAVARYRLRPVALREWESRYPELPRQAWLGAAYRRAGLEQSAWTSPPMDSDRPQALFLPGEPPRFVTWGFKSWADFDPLRLWEVTPDGDPLVVSRGELRLHDGAAVLDVASAPDGASLTLLLGLPTPHPYELTPGEDPPQVGTPLLRRESGQYTTGLVEALPLEAFARESLRGEQLVADGGRRFNDWKPWLARADVEGAPWLACGGNRHQRDAEGREVADRTEGVCWFRRDGEVREVASSYPLRDVALSDDGALLALAAGHYSGGLEAKDMPPQEVLVYATESLGLLDRNIRFPALPSRVGFVPGSDTLVVGTNAQNVHRYRPATGWHRFEGAGTKAKWGGLLPSHNGIVRGFVTDPSRRYLLTVSGESGKDLERNPLANEVRVWELDGQAEDLDGWRLTELDEGIWDVSLAPGGPWLALSTPNRVHLRQWLLPSD